MSRAVRLAAIAPTHLNLNGDLGNLLVLERRLSFRGVNVEVKHLNGSENLDGYDFLLVGHGSESAWTQLLNKNSDLLERIKSYAEKGGALLAIASAADRLYPHLIGKQVAQGPWVSEFVTIEGIVGYKNTASVIPDLVRYKNSVLTQLHGPVLAKNPELADQIISVNNWADVSMTTPELVQFDELAEASRRNAFEH